MKQKLLMSQFLTTVLLFALCAEPVKSDVPANVTLSTSPTVQAKYKTTESAWHVFPVRTVETLPGLPPAASDPPLDAWGGRADRKGDVTGFIHTQKIGDRWWLVDPEGGLFLHIGVVSVLPSRTPADRATLKAVYGTPDIWAAKTTDLLRGLGFDGVGAWSDVAQLRKVAAPTRPLVYTILGNGTPNAGSGMMGAFGRKLKVIHAGQGHTGYRSDAMPIFHPDFAAFCEDYARPLAARAADPYLMGYFSDNELPMPRLDNYLSLPPDDPAMGSTYHAAKDWLDARKGKNAQLVDITDADREAWTEYAYDRYLSVTTAALRKADPHHLCLGPRFYGMEKRIGGMWRAAGRHLDVIAINHYGTWDPADSVARYAAMSGKPILISEFYAKGLDSGFPNTGGAGFVVPTQADRGLFYENFALGLLQSKACVGWHWFNYRDPDPTDPGAGAGISNKGLVDSRYAPYTPMANDMRALNERVYSAADYFDKQKK